MNEIERPVDRPGPNDLLNWFLLFLVFLLFRIGNQSIIGIGCAAIFSLCFLLNPDAYRNRRGSFRTVYGLMVFLWICAVILTVV